MSDAQSTHFIVIGGGARQYRVTINYTSGHWCECRGMVSMKKKYMEDAGRTHGTSCKHIKSTVRDHFNNDWGVKVPSGKGTRVLKNPPVSSKPTGRRAAIAATKAKREARRLAELQAASEGSSLIDRIAALEAAKVATG